MFSTGRIAVLVLVLVFLSASVEAGEVVVHLRTGSRLRGEILKENPQEIELKLADGMRMKIRRSLILDIKEIAGADPTDEPVVPDPDPAPEPLPPPPDPDAGTEGTPPVGDPRVFGIDWGGRVGRVPTITAAMLTRYFAYEYVAHATLAVSPHDPKYRDHVLAHGHGGCLSSWDFRYVGKLELRYGDEVKFVAEITSPAEEDLSLIRLQEGPASTTARLVVMLVRREGVVRRYATTTIFEPRAFRQGDLAALDKQEQPIRTWTADYEPVARRWLPPAESEFLSEIESPSGARSGSPAAERRPADRPAGAVRRERGVRPVRVGHGSRQPGEPGAAPGRVPRASRPHRGETREPFLRGTRPDRHPGPERGHPRDPTGAPDRGASAGPGRGVGGPYANFAPKPRNRRDSGVTGLGRDRIIRCR